MTDGEKRALEAWLKNEGWEQWQREEDLYSEQRRGWK
jgi:hypothetical protein